MMLKNHSYSIFSGIFVLKCNCSLPIIAFSVICSLFHYFDMQLAVLFIQVFGAKTMHSKR